MRIGTPYTSSETKLLLLGSGELGKEIAIEAQRLGLCVVACDRYPHAPAMQVAHRSHVFAMTDGAALRRVVAEERPDFIVPEVEAIATDVLVELEADGHRVVPSARATQLTMNREGIRRLAAEKLELRTSAYAFAASLEAYRNAVAQVGLPCVVKPIMSSSGKGQSIVRSLEEVEAAWATAQSGARGQALGVIVEEYVNFDFEITLLTIRHRDGTCFCPPIGHRQVRGDYHESWQPHAMSSSARAVAETMATHVTDALGGRGLFGVEFFVQGDDVYFSEVSPRPHDTGMVTLISQDLSEFALHVRAILGLSVLPPSVLGPSASHVILGRGESDAPAFEVDPDALREPSTNLRLFGKPSVRGERRLGIALARGDDVQDARARAKRVAEAVTPVLSPAHG
ncbi:MAG: formate-dependent phosphoribosylglycinamide formyltransferase [Myxococcota bacterium]